MFPQVVPCPQVYPSEVTTCIDDFATYTFIPTMYDDTILKGDLAFNYLACMANAPPGQISSDWLGYSPLPEYTYGNIGYLSPASSLTSHGAMGSPLLFSPSPSPSLSQASTLERNQTSPEPSSTPEPSCRKAAAVYIHIRGKWCCSACDRAFVGKWECNRHIRSAGNKVMCLACRGKIKGGRGDSLMRHFTTHCKGDVANFRFEDAFMEV